MGDISLSKAVRSNLLSLQSTATMMAKTQERLSTGNKVNSALDNPTNFFTASGLNSRAGDMGQLMDSMANGIQTLEAADNGLTSITKTLESMQSTLRQARQDKSFQTQSFSLDATTVGSASAEVLTFSGGAFDGSATTKLHNSAKTGNNGFAGTGGTVGINGTVTIQADSLNGGTALSVDAVKTDTAATLAAKINDELSQVGSGNGGVNASVVDGQLKIVSTKGENLTVAGTAAQYVGHSAAAATTQANSSHTGTGGTADLTADLTALAGKTITLRSGGASVDYTFAGAADQSTDLVAALSAEGFTVTDGAAGLDISRADSADFTIETSDAALGTAMGIGAVTSLAVTNGNVASGTVTTISQANEVKTLDQLVSDINGDAALQGKIRASNDNGKVRIENLSTKALDIDGINSSGAIDGGSTGAAKILGNSVRADLADQFNELRDQLDKTADDASFNGINLLRGDNLKITFNETGTSSIDISTKNSEQVNAANMGVFDIKAEDLDSDATIDKLLGDLKSSLNSVRSQSSAFGSNLSIVQNRQDFTKNMINTLQTGGANLTLADMNEEAANLLALQTRQSLSSSSLSLASQADQSVLQLIR